MSDGRCNGTRSGACVFLCACLPGCVSASLQVVAAVEEKDAGRWTLMRDCSVLMADGVA